ncbi:endospore germination permease [Paenibacillus sp. NPDC056579]|uniref:GerAB/ArcD/ProY family transporter n=1 Tax=unclassified Paenibacillus TaxID=185978 RepID=UPI001EF988A3|nr:endospore germination permease [Paenibacillus sp. H1-7]ULL15468.1 spore gernimation protein [Paenibacillus sp. H1-7]
MVGDTKLSSRQFYIIVTLYCIGTSILITPAPLAAIAKEDAWLAAIAGVAISLLITALIIALGNMYPQLTLVQKCEKLLGKWLGKAVSLTFIFMSFFTGSELLYIIGDFLTTQIMPETPAVAVHILFACLVLGALRLGLETVARTAEFLFPWFLFLFILLVLFITPLLDFHNVKPILENGWHPIMSGAVRFASVFSMPTIVLLMIFPVSVHRPHNASKAFYIGIFIAGLLMIIVVSLTILVLGADITERQMYPSYNLAKKINIGNFVKRIEAVMAFMWFITIFIKMTFYIYAAVVGLAQTLQVKDYRFMLHPLGIYMVISSIVIHPNVVHSIEYDKEAWMPFIATFAIMLPIVLLGVYAFRRKKLHSR